MNLTKLAPWAVAVVSLGAVAYAARPARPVDGFDVEAFGHLPVQQGGRVKPVDTVARNALLMIRSQQTFRFDEDGPEGPREARSIGPDAWILDVFFRPDRADRQPIFVIDDPEVLGLMGKELAKSRYYTFEDLRPHLEQLEEQGQKAQHKNAQERTRFESAAANLYERLLLYHRLKNSVLPEGSPGLEAELASASSPAGRPRLQLLSQLAYFQLIPPAPGAPPAAWFTSGDALGAAGAGQVDPVLAPWGRLGAAWRVQEAGAFNAAVTELRGLETARAPEAVRHGDNEIVFNRAQPFLGGMTLYVLAFLALACSWLVRPELFRSLAFAFLAAGAVVHTAGLASRVLLQGYAPVTNLYSSAVFVGWAAVLVGVVLERIYRNGLGTVVASVVGFATLLIAHHLARAGDTMEMMRAVLDSNFWLGTHVTTITIGYAGTFLAGALAIAWTVFRYVDRGRDVAVLRQLAAATYGVICFALLFSFVGTVLGGIWADQSWGRFWGWDPKENGALLIVLWNAIILHARWGGFARDRGIMAMAIGGNIITSLSWFGVNMLGVGLHSYGFTDSGFWALTSFIGSQLVLIALTLLVPVLSPAEGAGQARPANPASAAPEPR
ncbi:MAG: cytochrome c biogenesis protein CcsA [Anaeromyxobacter sp.]